MRTATSFHIALFSLLFLVLPDSLTARQTATGIVYEDLNKNGMQDSGEPGIIGVSVSNQTDVVQTDENGRYSIPIREGEILFVTVPSGFTHPLNHLNLPQFYYIHNPDGSPDLDFPGITPTGDLPEPLNFGLIPSDNDHTFSMIAYGDPQPRNNDELSFYRDKIVNELHGTDADFVAVLGDIMFDDLSLFGRYNELMATLNRPVVNLFGNHDMNFDADGNLMARETFRSHFGPEYYAFEKGDVHFIVLDNIDYAGYNEEGNPSYRGGLQNQQMEWLENHLQYVDPEKLLVLMAHIPLMTPGLEDVGSLNTGNRREVIGMLDAFDHVLFLAGHMHTNFHTYLGEKYGRENSNPIHQIIASAASGSWWGGPQDPNGIPAATQRDGVPNGYHIIEFDGPDYRERFKAAGYSPEFQIRIESPATELTVKNINDAEIIANVFGGSEKSEVLFRVNNGEWKKMNYPGLRNSPYFEELLRAYPDSFAGWIQPVETNHIWSIPLPDNLQPGIHTIQLRTTDQFGQEFSETKVIEISE